MSVVTLKKVPPTTPEYDLTVRLKGAQVMDIRAAIGRFRDAGHLAAALGGSGSTDVLAELLFAIHDAAHVHAPHALLAGAA